MSANEKMLADAERVITVTELLCRGDKAAIATVLHIAIIAFLVAEREENDPTIIRANFDKISDQIFDMVIKADLKLGPNPDRI